MPRSNQPLTKRVHVVPAHKKGKVSAHNKGGVSTLEFPGLMNGLYKGSLHEVIHEVTTSFGVTAEIRRVVQEDRRSKLVTLRQTIGVPLVVPESAK